MLNSLFKRRHAPQSIDLDVPVDVEAAKKAAALVNAGDVDGASAICADTANPRATAFAAFRWIDTEEGG
ncbi:hypothetical protein [Streptomyces sp. NBC_01716]|uniref:hypothetical protein n=1 Tax=Streptomyces sp. NBC_01716 TaxID=2975917 RepID=UPI002E366DE0|nr:hypothetical protein [Streptomyces sp. NBC_01716]